MTAADRRGLLSRLPLLALAVAVLPDCVIAAADSTTVAAQGAARNAPHADARAWLTRMQAAASTGNYQGTLVVTVAGTMSSSRVRHYAVGEHIYEQMEMLDGRQQRILRHNDEVQTIWPQTRTALLEKRQTLGFWSTTPQEVQPAALDNYDIRRETDDRVAGRDAAVFMLEPRDPLRYPQRLWADIGTGLMLRADVLGLPTPASGNAPRAVLESTAFSEVAIGLTPQPGLVTQAMINPQGGAGYRVLRRQQQRTTLEAEGWALAAAVSGFGLAGCVRRDMASGTDGQDPVLQVVFTDGLTHVSLFVEGVQPQRQRSEMLAQRGATATLTQRRGDFWVTAVGDVPPATLRLFAASLERKRP